MDQDHDLSRWETDGGNPGHEPHFDAEENTEDDTLLAAWADDGGSMADTD